MRSIAPGLYHLVRSVRYEVTPERPDPTTQRILQVLCGNSPHVVGGPFAGLPYLAFASGSGLLPKIVGSYEAELHGVVRDAIAGRYDRLIDIGSGEGYYVAGFARAIDALDVVAVDTDALARARLKKLLQRNRLGHRVRVLAAIDAALLDQEVNGRTLIWSDCEGFEDGLLRTDLAPNLRRADLLVETHDFIRPGVLYRLVDRFARSHEVIVIPTAPRLLESYSALATLTPEEQAIATFEGRPGGMQWLWLRSKAGAGS